MRRRYRRPRNGSTCGFLPRRKFAKRRGNSIRRIACLPSLTTESRQCVILRAQIRRPQRGMGSPNCGSCLKQTTDAGFWNSTTRSNWGSSIHSARPSPKAPRESFSSLFATRRFKGTSLLHPELQNSTTRAMPTTRPAPVAQRPMRTMLLPIRTNSWEHEGRWESEKSAHPLQYSSPGLAIADLQPVAFQFVRTRLISAGEVRRQAALDMMSDDLLLRVQGIGSEVCEVGGVSGEGMLGRGRRTLDRVRFRKRRQRRRLHDLNVQMPGCVVNKVSPWMFAEPVLPLAVLIQIGKIHQSPRA